MDHKVVGKGIKKITKM